MLFSVTRMGEAPLALSSKVTILPPVNNSETPLKSFQLAVVLISQVALPTAQSSGIWPVALVVATRDSVWLTTSLLRLPAMPAGKARAVVGREPVSTPV